MNTFGRLFRLSSFGESHGHTIGGIVDGCPAGVPVDLDKVASIMAKRRPGSLPFVSPRRESDIVRFLSGLDPEGRSTGAPIAFVIENKDVKSSDYADLSEVFRPGHADYTYALKYGIRATSGGGRSSARETAVRCVGGAIALALLRETDITISAYVRQIGSAVLDFSGYLPPERCAENLVYDSALRCPDKPTAERMYAVLAEASASGDSLGGVVDCVVSGMPAGFGEPVYDKLDAKLAGAMLGINAARGFELGAGFSLASKRGSEANDVLLSSSRGVVFSSNHGGGILGGISSGQDLCFRVAFKPTPTIGREQQTVNRHGETVTMAARGRHDTTVVIRAVPVVEAMTAMVLADAYLQGRVGRPID